MWRKLAVAPVVVALSCCDQISNEAGGSSYAPPPSDFLRRVDGRCPEVSDHYGDGRRCQEEALRSRCNFIDECLLECALDEADDRVAGGCKHICMNNFPNLKWSPPQESADCSN